MSGQKIFIPLFGTILLLAVLFSNFSYPARAGVPTVDPAMMNKEYIMDGVLRVIAQVGYIAVRGKLINLVQGAGRDGGAGFVQNWRNFQTEAQYRGEDVFRSIAANTKFCNYLDANIKTTFRITNKFKISLKGQNIRIGNLDPYTLRARCTLPNNFDMAKYQKDFAGNGGWAAFIRMLEPQNNPFGSLLLAEDELERQRQLEINADINEAVSGRGYTSKRDGCTKQQGTIRCTFLGKVLTPGDVLGASVEAALHKDLEWLTSSDELTELVSAILTDFIAGIGNLAENSPSQDLPDNDDERVGMLEYCTARKPRAEVLEKYIPMFDPYGWAAEDRREPCGDLKEDDDNPYPYGICVQQCLKAVGYIDYTTGDGLPKPEDLKRGIDEEGDICQEIDVNGPSCTNGVTTGCRAYCVGVIPGAPEGCGSFTNGSLAYQLAAGHLSLDTRSNKLFNPGQSGSSDYRDWQWFRAPSVDDADAWCNPDNAPESTNPPAQAPQFPALARCADGSTGGLETLPGCSGGAPSPTGGPSPTGAPPPSGQCQRELPAGQSGPYGGDLKSIIEEIANSGSGILDKNDVSAGSYKILNFEAYMGEIENKLKGRGYVFVRRDTIDTREMMMKKSDSEQYAQQYNLARTGDYTRIAHKGLNCTP